MNRTLITDTIIKRWRKDQVNKMEDTKVKGLVVMGQDYKETDKLITIVTPQGKKVFVAKGVKSPKAKLKSCVMPFCFGDFVLVERGGRNTLISAEIIDNFFDITSDYDKYVVGCKILEFAQLVCQDNDSSDLLLMLLDNLSNLAYTDVSPKMLLIKFLLKLTGLQGFDINMSNCRHCGKPLGNKVYFDYDSGEVLCDKCRNYYCYELPYKSLDVLRSIQEAEKLEDLKIDIRTQNELLDLLIKNFNIKFGTKIKNI